MVSDLSLHVAFFVLADSNCDERKLYYSNRDHNRPYGIWYVRVVSVFLKQTIVSGIVFLALNAF